MNFLELDELLLSHKGKIIHQIWFRLSRKSKKLYLSFEKYRNSWKDKNPRWYHYVWTKENSLSLFKTYFKNYLSLYLSYPYEIQRIDILRYFILLRYGGIYADMDMECINSIENYPFKEVCIVESLNRLNDRQVSNSFMYSIPGCLFWKKVISKLRLSKDVPRYYPRHLEIMLSTGPAFLNRMVSRYLHRYRVSILPADKFNPCSLEGIKNEISTKEIYTYHHGAGSWENGDSKFLIFLYLNYKMILFIIGCLILPLINFKKG